MQAYLAAYPSNLAAQAANAAYCLRARDSRPVSKIGLRVMSQGGTIFVAVHRSSGRGRTFTPGARLSTSGTVACPSVGYAEVALTTPVYVHEGEWLDISCADVSPRSTPRKT